MSKKIVDAIVAGIKESVARAKGAERRGRALRRALRRADSYSRAEVLVLGKAFPRAASSATNAAFAFPHSPS